MGIEPYPSNLPRREAKRSTIARPTSLGRIGVEIDEDYVKERAKEGHRWRNPVWRHKDGSFAEW